jgi:putative monooxygenase ydhR
MHALVVTYELGDATRAEHAELCEELAPAFAAVPGLHSLTWLTNAATGSHGGFYVFETKSAFDRFVASELFETLRSHRTVRGVATSDFSIESRPTAITRGLPQAAADRGGR